MELNLVPFNSDLWKEYGGAYGNVCDEVKLIMDNIENIPSRNEEEKTDYELDFEDICENLSHQMSFYNATYITMPYLLKFFEQKEKENDFDWQLNIITSIGFILATDIPYNKTNKVVPKDIIENYEKSVLIFQKKTKEFLDKYAAKLKELEEIDRMELSAALLAILFDREIAFFVIIGSWEDLCMLCEECEYCYEDSVYEEEFVSNFEPCKKEKYEDIYSVLEQIGAEKEAEIISYYYGTFTCPECGTTKTVLEFAKSY